MDDLLDRSDAWHAEILSNLERFSRFPSTRYEVAMGKNV
jgi:hypothetical protein